MKRKQLLQEPKTTTEKKIQKQTAEEIVQLVWNLSFGHNYKRREHNYSKNKKIITETDRQKYSSTCGQFSKIFILNQLGS